MENFCWGKEKRGKDSNSFSKNLKGGVFLVEDEKRIPERACEKSVMGRGLVWRIVGSWLFLECRVIMRGNGLRLEK